MQLRSENLSVGECSHTPLSAPEALRPFQQSVLPMPKWGRGAETCARALHCVWSIAGTSGVLEAPV